MSKNVQETRELAYLMWEPLLGFYSRRVMLRSEHRKATSAAGWAAAENAFPTVALAATLLDVNILNKITTDKYV